jgi:integration host factor subunit alpha
MTLTKNHIVKSVRKGTGLPKTISNGAVKSLFGIIKKTLQNGESVLISGFGKFSVRQKNERRGRNPKTGERMILESRRVVAFKSSLKLRDKVNGESFGSRGR